jgi:hypothetical protein
MVEYRIRVRRGLILVALLSALAVLAVLPLVVPPPARAGIVVDPGSLRAATTPGARAAPRAAGYAILAANDLGMHCIQKGYSAMMILPPANFLHVQIFRKSGGEDVSLVTSGVKVTYSVRNMKNAAKHTDFWKYAASYGFKNLKPGKGITGNGLSGTMKLSADRKYWEATAIPVVPYTSNGTFNAYPVATVTVKSKSGTTLAMLKNVVLPVSDEMHCDNCHAKKNTFQSILTAHDQRSGTNLAADLKKGKRYACSSCHADPVLGAPGKRGVKSLSEAMHSFHGSRMSLSNLANPCYNCHPGLKTRCLRGAMYAAGKTCVSCHGDVARVGSTIAAGRTPWLNEPDCGNAGCHNRGANPGKLYRQSYLTGSHEGMNNKILCEMCHNGTHAEWRSTKALDNKVPIALQGTAGPVGKKCGVCHSGSGKVHSAAGG